MGSDQSKHVNIYVRTEKPYYFSGELVTGKYQLTPTISESGFPGNQIFLKIKGQEVCNWTESRSISESDGQGGTRQRTETDHFHGKSVFYSHKIFLHGFQGQYLQTGQYEFPFQFQLFGHLPGSFCQKGSDWDGSVRYKVKAEIESFNKKSKKIKHNQELIVREPLKSQMAALFGEMHVHAKTWCCISQGESHIKCAFDKNHYLPGDKAFLWIDLDNSNCDLDVQELRGTLTQTITLRSNINREKIVTYNLVNERAQGIPARSHAKDENRKTMELILRKQNNNQNDQTIQPSTSGQIVKCQYSLSAAAHLSGCTCCTTDPHVTVPINIVASVPITYSQVPMVSNWNPQTFQPVLVSFNEQDLYVKSQGTNQQQGNYNYPGQNPNYPGQNPNVYQMNNQMQ